MRLLSTIVPAGAGFALLGLVATADVAADGLILPTANGDVNGSSTIDISDAVYLLSHLFLGGPEPMPLACEPDVAVLRGEKIHNGDVNGRGGINISDPIYLLTWLFGGGPKPVEGCPLSGG
jgi:hypothetical protein